MSEPVSVVLGEVTRLPAATPYFDVAVRAAASLLTLYMLLILLRWCGGPLELDFNRGYWRWIPRLTEPFVNRVRRILPSMGPMDFGPIAAIFAVWVVKMIVLHVMLDIKGGL